MTQTIFVPRISRTELIQRAVLSLAENKRPVDYINPHLLEWEFPLPRGKGFGVHVQRFQSPWDARKDPMPDFCVDGGPALLLSWIAQTTEPLIDPCVSFFRSEDLWKDGDGLGRALFCMPRPREKNSSLLLMETLSIMLSSWVRVGFYPIGE